MSDRLPFASGLPGADLRGPRVIDPVGLSLLQALRTWAQAKADDARPRARTRFDGVERTPADVDAIAEVEAGDALVRLLDGLTSDALMAQRAAQLVRGRR